MSTESIIKKSTFPINRTEMVHNNFNEQELISSTTSDDSHTPLSETVTTLASNVYKELERIIKNFGENSVKDLMPVMISTLGNFFYIRKKKRMFFLLLFRIT
jgi:hypothetical protein